MEQLLHFLQGSGPSDILAALLMILGALRIVARYTPWKADDHFLDIVESPLRYAASFFRKGDK